MDKKEKTMLPLDEWDERIGKAFASHGVSEESIRLSLVLDLDTEGGFGETILAYDAENKVLYRLAYTAKGREDASGEESFVSYEGKDIDSMYVDNFVSSCRLLFRCGEGGAKTIVAAYSTNSRKKKLFAFIDIYERLAKGEAVEADDPIFEQFNQKCPKCGRRYTDQNRKICEHCLNKGAIFGRLLGYFRGHIPQFVTVLVMMLLTTGISLLNPIINGMFVYDRIISPEGDLHTVGWLVVGIGMIFGLGVLSVIVQIVQNRANAKMSTRVTLEMKLDIFSSLQKLSLSFFNNNQTGRLITRVDYDADRIRSFFIDGIPNLIINGLNFIGLTVVLLFLNWKLTLLVFIPVPIIVIMFKTMLPKLWRAHTKTWRASSSLNAMLGDSLTGIRVVKAFAKEVDEANRFNKYNRIKYETNLYLNIVSLTIFPIIGLLIGISSQVIWGVGGFEVMNKTMTYGEFTTFFGYIGMIFGPLNFFTNFTSMLTDTINSAQRMFEIVDAVPEITDAKDAIDVGRIKGDIEFRKVCFHYAANRPILKNMSFKINAGDHIGLVGHTGSGKSTIANLICRLYDCISGAVYIDGYNIRDIKTECLRKNIAIVSQEIFMFRGTIADNVRYAKPDATMDEIIAVCKAANAHDFITTLPDGYETIVGVGSRSLSGGEKQRVSIARALLLEPSVLILDEATAAMDTETEKQIQEALGKLIEGRTTITIAHRLATLKDCNYLYAIDDGEIAEGGTHSELIGKKGIYYKLYKLQSDAMKRVLSAS